MLEELHEQHLMLGEALRKVPLTNQLKEKAYHVIIGAMQKEQARQRVYARRRWFRPALTVAALIMISLAGLIIYNTIFKPPPLLTGPASLTLQDGSRLKAKAGARYQIKGPRWIYLDYGELVLNVISSKTHPFKVETKVGTVLARGTRFTISVKKEGGKKGMKLARLMVTVVVLSGVVELVNPWGSQIAGPKELLYAQEGQKPQKQDLAKDKVDWEELPEPPIGGRRGHTTLVWGSKLVIWSGWAGGPLRPNDEAIFDLETREWEKIDPAPIFGRANHSTILWGSKMVVWGGHSMQEGRESSDGAILDLKTKEWEELPEAPIDARARYNAFLWGSKMVIWGGGHKDGAIFDLETKKWENYLRHLSMQGATIVRSSGIQSL
jgi:hypothetical protein